MILQPERFSIASLQLGLLFLSIGTILAIVRILAVKSYRAERGSSREASFLGALGETLANTPVLEFNVLNFLMFILGCFYMLDYISQQIGSENMMLPLGITAVGMFAALVLFHAATVRGRAIVRKGRVIRDHRNYGHQDWVIQKRLLELVKEKEGSDRFRAEVAQKVLESLMAQENMTGDAVRRIMADPAGPIDRFEDRTIPNPFWEVRFSLSLITFIFAAILVLSLGASVGMVSSVDYFNLVLILIGLVFVSICCLCMESQVASQNRLRLKMASS